MNVFVRVDASTRIGTGHVMRCLALGQALRHGGAAVTFIMREPPPPILAMLRHEEFGVRTLRSNDGSTTSAADRDGWLGVPWETDALQTAAILKNEEQADWLVVDHYGIDHQWEERVRTGDCKVLAIDDLAQHEHACEMLLNQNLMTDVDERYRALVSQDCQLLAGPQFALLRQEFRDSRVSLRREFERVTNLLVFLGGADSGGITLKALEAVNSMHRQDIRVTVVIGAANPHRAKIERLYAERKGYRVISQAKSMAQLMVEADLAIGAGGSSTWERCCLGLPTVAIAIAENQFEVAKTVAEAGACLYMGASANLSDEELGASLTVMIGNPSLRKSLSKVGMNLVDGLGCQRVAKVMSQKPLRVRPARADDAERVFAWRNAEETRRYSHDPKMLTPQEHAEWFQRTLMDSKRLLLIGEGTNGPVGVLRYDFVDRAATVSIYLDPTLHGQGYGARLLFAGEHWLRLVRPDIERLRAE